MENQTENKIEQNPESELSYEEEQLQMLLIQESEKQKIQMDRELRETQEKEYNKSLQKDLEQDQQIEGFNEPSKEEMIAVRLKRFDKKG